jgi:hypothetical protein
MISSQSDSPRLPRSRAAETNVFATARCFQKLIQEVIWDKFVNSMLVAELDDNV